MGRVEDIVATMFRLITRNCTKQLWKEEREPKNEEEEEELAVSFKLAVARMKLLKYRPHHKQRWFHASDACIKCFVGSNQSGKTTALLVDVLDHALGYRIWENPTNGHRVVRDLEGNPIKPPVRILVGAEDYVNAHAEVIIPKLNELLPLDLLEVTEERIQGRISHKFTFPRELGGSSIKLMSYEADPSKWEGYTAHFFALDEPPPRHALIGLRRGAMRHSAQIAMSFTPLKEPWLFEDVYNAPECIHIEQAKDLERVTPTNYSAVNVDLADTPYISEENKKRFIAGLNDEEREARQHASSISWVASTRTSLASGMYLIVPLGFRSTPTGGLIPDFWWWIPTTEDRLRWAGVWSRRWMKRSSLTSGPTSTS